MDGSGPVGGQERIDALIGRHAEMLSERLQAHRAQLFTPDAKKTLRTFTSGETAQLLGVTDAYLRTLSRYPKSEELATASEYLTSSSDLREGLEGLMWALLNTKEFIVNH